MRMSETRPEVSVVVPMYNEEENVEATVERIHGALQPLNTSYEIVLVNDGSTDGTEAVATQVAERDSAVHFVSYPINQGRGKALRTGFLHANGELVVTTEADLSWGEDIVCRLVNELRANPGVDVVVASPHMPGGGFAGVPWLRAMVSRVGNRILGLTMPRGHTMMTGMTRAYRRRVLEAMELESNGKEIHVEIMSKIVALGFIVKEIPATLTWRAKGKSKFKFRRTASSHLVLTFFEKPMILFGGLGAVLLVLGLIFGVFVSVLRFEGHLTAGRPLITVVAILVIGGLQMVSFGLIGSQIVALRKELFRVQQENLRQERMLQQLLAARPEDANGAG